LEAAKLSRQRIGFKAFPDTNQQKKAVPDYSGTAFYIISNSYS